jgi:integrase
MSLEFPDERVFLAATTGLRVSELLGLKWQDINFETLEIHLVRAIVNGVVGDMKTKHHASQCR